MNNIVTLAIIAAILEAGDRARFSASKKDEYSAEYYVEKARQIFREAQLKGTIQ